MRELDTASPVVWPSWCYSGDSQEVEKRGSGRRKAKIQSKIGKMTTVEPSAGTGAGQVKSERLSPSSSAPGDAASSSSRSGTPSSSYPGTPPGTQRLSPTHHPPPLKHMEAMNRNYSDFMRSLAAKYNNNHPNDYFSGRNGFSGSLKPGTSPPFPGLLPPPSPVAPTGTVTKEEEKTPAEAQPPMLGFVSFPPVFPPVIDMNATQALINMVRSHAGTAHQLENYLKGAAKRSPTETLNSPLDLSLSSQPRQSPLTLPPPVKRHKKSLSESLYGTDVIRSVGSRKPGAALSPKIRKTLPPTPPRLCMSVCSVEKPCSNAPDSQTINHWTVEDVVNFVNTIDMCAEYASNFRDQRIDGSALPLLTEEHLTTSLGMKLGPALKLRSILSTRLGQCSVCLHCTHCHGPAPSEK